MAKNRDDAPGRSDSALTIIATGTRVVGELDGTGVVKIEGTVVGTVRAERQVLVAKGGIIEGDILAREAVLGGEVRGSVQAGERVEVQEGAVVHGDITTKRLVVAEGGEVNGTITMGEPPSPKTRITDSVSTSGGVVRQAVR
jgi:cytoskeletal protein CcmA (bactofilin family)